MSRTANSTILRYDYANVEPSFADVVYVLTTPSPGEDSEKTRDLSSRITRYVALFAYSLAHPQQFASWVNDAWRISETIEDATYPEVRRKWAVAAKVKATYAVWVARLFLFAPEGPEARAREAAVRPMPVYGPPEDG